MSACEWTACLFGRPVQVGNSRLWMETVEFCCLEIKVRQELLSSDNIFGKEDVGTFDKCDAAECKEQCNFCVSGACRAF